MIQQLEPREADQLADELRQLREALQKSICSAQDAIEVGAIAEAEEAAKKRDRGGLLAAVKRWGAKALDKAMGLGLSILQTWISVHAGLPMPPPTAALPSGEHEHSKG